MTQEQILQVFRDTGVMLEGHFLLTSGRHSDRYMQCAHLFEHASHSEALCKMLADAFRDDGVTLVVGPALGGIIMSYEMARQLGCRNIFAERENGAMTFRRGFEIKPGDRVLMVEDTVTTGGSVREVIELLRAQGAELVGVGAIVDRSAGKVDFGVPFRAVLSMDVVSYEAADCPLCREGKLALVKPGSRALKG